ncbi:MAG: hypothetical protein ACXWPM_08015, partial [Bdellovibrionota bacterium]
MTKRFPQNRCIQLCRKRLRSATAILAGKLMAHQRHQSGTWRFLEFSYCNFPRKSLFLPAQKTKPSQEGGWSFPLGSKLLL